MAIVFNASAKSKASAVTSLTFAHSSSGSNRVLLVGAHLQGTAQTVTGVTYNSVAMTQEVTRTAANTVGYVFSLSAPSAGSNNVVISASGATGINGISVSLTGATQSTAEATNSGQNSAGVKSVSYSVVTVTDNAWIFNFWSAGLGDTDFGVDTLGASQIKREETDGDPQIGLSIGDTKGPITPAGASTVSVSWDGANSGAGNVQGCSVAMAAAAAVRRRAFPIWL
ncbi:MAG: hypothetical protein AAB922_04315 [Patescibacteria group bacterium]